jgi:hypothetical protein
MNISSPLHLSSDAETRRCEEDSERHNKDQKERNQSQEQYHVGWQGAISFQAYFSVQRALRPKTSDGRSSRRLIEALDGLHLAFENTCHCCSMR